MRTGSHLAMVAAVRRKSGPLHPLLRESCMSNAARNIVLATALVAATGVSFAARQGSDAPLTNPLAVSMLADSSPRPGLHGHGAIQDHQQQQRDRQGAVLAAAGREPREPSCSRSSATASRSTTSARWSSAPAPTEADLVTFQPYETKVVSVDLAKSYDLRPDRRLHRHLRFLPRRRAHRRRPQARPVPTAAWPACSRRR